MKRTLSFLLALVMVLGTFTTVFAAEPTVEEAAGALLKEFGVLQGNQDGELNLGQDLKRRDAVVLLSRLMDAEEDAKVFPADDLVFDDITDAYYKGYIAWAVSNGLAKGKSATKFDPNGALTAQHFATFLLRALGHKVEGEAYDNALETAKELGLLADVEVVNSTVVKRGVMAVMSVNALGTPMNGSEETLAAKLGLEMPVEEPTLSTDIEVTAVAAIANNKVEVKVKEEVAASVADFAIVKKGTTTAVEVKDVVKESAKVFVLETEALVGGTAYTLTSNGKTLNFTGVALDKTAPMVKSVTGTDTNRFEVEFSDVMDKVTAEDVENYVFDKELKVVKAVLDVERKVVELETDAAKRNTTYKLTIEKVTNSDGIAMKKASFNVRAKEYTTAPSIVGNPRVLNSTLIELRFNANEYGMNKESLEDIANYEIEGLEVLKATAYDLDTDYIYEYVLLETAEQEPLKAYKLTVTGVTDNSVLKNELRKRTLTFRALTADKTGPDVKSIKEANADRVVVMFNEVSAMDIDSMTDISNYRITYKDGGDTVELGITKAVARGVGYPNAFKDARKGVTLYTEEQDSSKNYTIEISNVEDEYGNPMKLKRTFSFRGSDEDLTPPNVVKVEHVVDEGVVVTFSEVLNATIASDPTNYVIDGNIGAAVKVKFDYDNYNKVTLKTPALTSGKQYSVTISNIEDSYGNVMPNRKVNFVAINTSVDTTAPSFAYAYAANENEVHVSFDEYIDGTPTYSGVLEVKNSDGDFIDSTIGLTYVGKINDGTTVVYKTSVALGSNEYKFKTFALYDKAGNKVDISGKTFQGTTSENTAPTIEFVDQVDVKTIIVTFSEPVELTGSVTIKEGNNTITSTSVSQADPYTDNTHETEWEIEFVKPLTYGKDYKFQTLVGKDLSNALLTNAGTGDNGYGFIANIYDDVAPSIVGVEATHHNRIVVEYDEGLAIPGAYKVYYYNNNNQPVQVTPVAVTGLVHGAPNKVAITVDVSDLSRVYYLQTVVGAQDYAGEREKVDGYEWNFQGSKVKADDTYITGITLINATKLEVRANFTMTSLTVTAKNKATNVSEAVYLATGSPAKYPNTNVYYVVSKIPFLAGIEYTVTSPSLSGTRSDKVEGLISDREIEIRYEDSVYEVYTNNVKAEDAGFEVEILDFKGDPATIVGDTEFFVLLKDENSGAILYAAKVLAP